MVTATIYGIVQNDESIFGREDITVWKLEKNAANCMGCGHCSSLCPFLVAQMERLREIKEYFDNGTV